jgi:predicted dehydrogenase
MTSSSNTHDRPPAHQKPVRVAVVGLGYWGPNLVRNLRDIDEADVVAACDIRPAPRAAIERRFPDVRVTESFEEILADPLTDAVAIATPVSTHHVLCSAALDAGKHVFVEKPLAASSVECLDLIERAEERGLMLMPGHTFLYSPAVKLIHELITGGDLGEIYFISMSRVNLGLHQPDVSVAWDLGSHDFAILRYWLDETPSFVSAISRSCVMPGTADVAFINVGYPSGTIAHVELSWLAPSKLRRTAVVGSEKMVVYDDTSTEPVRIFDSGVIPRNPETFGEFQLAYRAGDIVSPRLPAVEPLALELQDFCNAIRLGTEPRSSASFGLEVVRAIEAIDESLGVNGAAVTYEGRSD